MACGKKYTPHAPIGVSVCVVIVTMFCEWKEQKVVVVVVVVVPMDMDMDMDLLGKMTRCECRSESLASPRQCIAVCYTVL